MHGQPLTTRLNVKLTKTPGRKRPGVFVFFAATVMLRLKSFWLHDVVLLGQDKRLPMLTYLGLVLTEGLFKCLQVVKAFWKMLCQIHTEEKGVVLGC